MEWRLELKPGDIVDAHDSSKIWYASTIIDRIIKTEDDGNQYILLKIGYRMYSPEGNKQDYNK